MINYDSHIKTIRKLLQPGELNGLKIFRNIQIFLMDKNKSGLEHNLQSNIPAAKSNNIGLNPIGTWHPTYRNDEIIFIRQEQSDSIFWESTRQEIKQKKDKASRRVCVIGESAALGMFFSPQISPTSVLSSCLKQHSTCDWDVIDLTRSCMNAGALIATSKAALQLGPDFIVILAGNNWFSDVIFEHDAPFSKRHPFINILETEGPEGLISYYKKNIQKHAENILSNLNLIAESTKTQFIFAMPASNYADWERRSPIYWLENGRTSEWYELYHSAALALEKKEYREALTLGHKMYSIDGGYSATSNRIIANSLIALKCYDEAYNYCINETDYSLMHDQLTSFPGTPSFLKTALILSNKNHIHLIDLEKLFSEFLGGKILDNTLFVDYCHMTPEGFSVAMAPIASLLLSLDKQECILPWKSFVEKNKVHSLDQFQLAISYFYVALYNCHFNEPVTYLANSEWAMKLFQKAVDYSSDLLHVMELYVRARSCYFGAGFSLSSAGQELFQLINSPLDFPIAQSAPGVDRLTIEAICEILERNGRQGYALMAEYQLQYIKLLEEGVDLTEPLYIERINSIVRLAVDHEISTRRKLPFFKSWWPRSYFNLVANANSDLELQITCRLSQPDIKDKNVAILINNKPLTCITVTDKWKKHQLIIHKELLNSGFNSLAIEWPKLKQVDQQEIEKVAERYSVGLKVDLFPIFGEIFSLIVRNKRINELS